MDIQFMQAFQKRIQNSTDIKYRRIGSANGAVHLFYVEELCDPHLISLGIVSAFAGNRPFCPDKSVVMQDVLQTCAVGEVETVGDAIGHLLTGDSILLFDFLDDVIYCETKKVVKRAVGKSDIEPGLKGSKEAFNEMLSDNLGLIRRRLNDSALKIEYYTVGTQSHTQVAFLYLEGTAPAALIAFMRQNITDLVCPSVQSHNVFAEHMAPQNTTLDTIGYTERPDSVVAQLVEGRVAVVINGSPVVLTAPHFFIENFHAADDYYSNRLVVNLIRVLRLVSFLIALLLPGFFIALSTYHFSLIPTTFILKLAVQRSGAPVPTVVEVIVLQFFFELAREAGKRLPQQIGQSLSIVSALILGEAAVGAGVTSETTVVVIGVYAIGSFLNPKLSGTTYFWSLFIVIVSSMMGLFGFYLALVVFIAHISSLRSCGYPFLFPLGTPASLLIRPGDLFLRGNVSEIKRKVL